MGNNVGAFPRRADYGPLPVGPDSGNTAFVVVTAERGPTGSARLIQSSSQYNAVYGGAGVNGFSAGYEAVQTLLTYGVRKIQVIRVTGSGGGVAKCTLQDADPKNTLEFATLGIGEDLNLWEIIIEAGTKAATFKMTLKTDSGVIVEVYDNLTATQDSLNRVTSNSQYLSAAVVAGSTGDLPAFGDYLVSESVAGSYPTSAQTPDAADVIGTDAGNGVKTGLKAFENCALGRGILLAPDLDFDSGVRAAMQGQTEDKYFRIAYLSGAPEGSTPATAIADVVSARTTTGAGYAYPRLRKVDTSNGNEKTVSAAAYIVGQWLSDVNTTPAKAPAGLDYGFPGTLGPETYFNGQAMIDEAIAENLYANGINPIWPLNCKDIRCYGARATATDLKWTYLHTKYLWVWLAERSKNFLTTLIFDTVVDDTYTDIQEAVYAIFVDAYAKGAFLGELPPQGEVADPEKHAFHIVCSEELQTDLDKQNNNYRIAGWFRAAGTLETITFDLSSI